MSRKYVDSFPPNIFTPINILGRGGSAYVIEVEINYDYNDLKKGDKLTLKHCIGSILYEACDIFITEANTLKMLREDLYETNICGNFPIFYNYNIECLFGTLESLNDIYEFNELFFKQKNFDIPDIIFYYANIDNIGDENINMLINEYGYDLLMEARDRLKIKNFNVISQLFPKNNNIFNSYDILDFLDGEKNVDCAPGILMSKIEGLDLSSRSKSDFYVSDSVIFDIMYTNICFALFYGKIISDDNAGNTMVEFYNIPKIYKINNIYYMFNDGYRGVRVDVQSLTNYNKGLLLGYLKTHILDKTLIQDINKSADLNEIIEDVIPKNFNKYIISENYAKEIVVKNPNVKIWNMDLIFSQIN